MAVLLECLSTCTKQQLIIPNQQLNGYSLGKGKRMNKLKWKKKKHSLAHHC